ncbi:MAG: BMC domain-containing protein [Peptococcaceae bacterium]
MKALGLIELLGYVPAVVALDTALKTAEVSFQQISKIDKGIVSLTVTGDVSAVQAAMDAAAAAAEQVGQVLYVHVIPRPHDEVDEMLNPPPAAPQAPQPPFVSDGSGDEPDSETAAELPQAETAQEVSAEESVELTADLKAQMENLTLEVLEEMTVKELRTIARELNITNMSRKEIRFGKKEDLVASICKYLEQEC